jgi:hypothetical protein
VKVKPKNEPFKPPPKSIYFMLIRPYFHKTGENPGIFHDCGQIMLNTLFTSISGKENGDSYGLLSLHGR